jgi:hypothetical protein
MKGILLPALGLGAALLLGGPPSASAQDAPEGTLKVAEKSKDSLRRHREDGEVFYEQVTRTGAKCTFLCPMTLTEGELGDLDDTWGLAMGLDSSYYYNYGYLVSTSAYGGGSIYLDLRLSDDGCNWREGRSTARWVIEDDYYYDEPPVAIVNAKWNPDLLKVLVTSRQPIFTGGDVGEGEVHLDAMAMLAFGDLDDEAGPAMAYIFGGDLYGTASVRQVSVGQPGYEYYYYLVTERVAGTITGTLYEPPSYPPYYPPY